MDSTGSVAFREEEGVSGGDRDRRFASLGRVQSDILSAASHELRTPLNAIVGFTELLHDGKLGPVAPEQKEHLADILSSARHLLRLLTDVLDMTRPESGIHPQEVPLAAAARDVRDLLRGRATRGRVHVDLDLPGDGIRAFVDRARLLQLLFGFLSYAIRSTPADGRVRLVLGFETDGSVRVDVHCGTCDSPRAADASRIDLRSPTENAIDPGGLEGLAFARGVVEEQGGSAGSKAGTDGGTVLHAIVPVRRA
jgi:signal transduction histidine kinase